MNAQNIIFESISIARMAEDPRLSITNAFDNYKSMQELLRRLGISAKCITHFMDEEGFESARDLALARETDVKSIIDNVNKLFGSATGTNRIYFPPIKVTRIKALCE